MIYRGPRRVSLRDTLQHFRLRFDLDQSIDGSLALLTLIEGKRFTTGPIFWETDGTTQIAMLC